MRFETVAAPLGNPSFYEGGFREHSSDQLEQLRQMGVDTVFVNLAWSRPWIDAVVLEHLVRSDAYPLLSGEQDIGRNLRLFQRRAEAVKRAGMRAFGLFGVPHYFDYERLPESYRALMGASESTIEAGKSLTCIASDDVIELYVELFQKLCAQVPELSGALIYTYDELAEVCDAQSDCPRCRGIPAERRIPAFLNRLYQGIRRRARPDFELWWEPWELSAGQTYRVLEALDPGIGVSCHTTINEVYFANETDQWFRNVANLCQSQGRRMIGEVFVGGSGEDIGAIAGYPCPRLVWRQLDALRRLPGVGGVKEYYGIATEYASVNEAMFARCVASDAPYDALVGELAATYAFDPRPLLEAWERGSEALELVPWDLSWALRFGNYLAYDPAYWAKNRFVDLMKTPWSTPSWLSSRRSFYLVVDCECNYTKALVDDLGIRFSMAVERLDEALGALRRCALRPEARREGRLWAQALELMRVQLLCRLNHLLLSERARAIREGERPHDVDELLASELSNAGRLLSILERPEAAYRLDIANVKATMQAISACRDLHRRDPALWAERHYLPAGAQPRTGILSSL